MNWSVIFWIRGEQCECFSVFLAFLLASNAPAFEGNESTGDCGTLLSFHHDYEAAFELAAKENKPLFVVHLSGNLRNEDYT